MGVETGVCEGGRKLSSPLTRVSVESFHSMKIINHIPLTSRSHSRSHIPSQSHQRSSSQRAITFKNDFFTINKSHYALRYFDVAPSETIVDLIISILKSLVIAAI